MRILITGSRTWEDVEYIKTALSKYAKEYVTLISGNASGADAICESVAESFNWEIERHPADWSKYGKKAGYIRNKFMIDECSPDICIGFIINDSRGATMTINMAKDKGIEVQVHQIYV